MNTAMSVLSVESQTPQKNNKDHTFVCEPSDRPVKKTKLNNNTAMSVLSVESHNPHIHMVEHVFVCEPSDRPFKKTKLSNDNDNLIDNVLFATPFTGAFVGILTGPFSGFTQPTNFFNAKKECDVLPAKQSENNTMIPPYECACCQVLEEITIADDEEEDEEEDDDADDDDEPARKKCRFA